MPSHFVSLNRGQEGSPYSDYTTGTATSGAVFELRLDDASNFNRRDVEIAVQALHRFFENPQLWATAGFVLNG